MHWFQQNGLPLPTKFLFWRQKKNLHKKNNNLEPPESCVFVVGYDCHLLYPTKWPYTPYLPEPNRCPGCCVAQAVLQGHQLFPLANPTPRQLDLNYSCSGQKFIKLHISSDVLFVKNLHTNFQTYIYRHIISMYFFGSNLHINPPPLVARLYFPPQPHPADPQPGNLWIWKTGGSIEMGVAAISGTSGPLRWRRLWFTFPQRF